MRIRRVFENNNDDRFECNRVDGYLIVRKIK